MKVRELIAELLTQDLESVVVAPGADPDFDTHLEEVGSAIRCERHRIGLPESGLYVQTACRAGHPTMVVELGSFPSRTLEVVTPGAVRVLHLFESTYPSRPAAEHALKAIRNGEVQWLDDAKLILESPPLPVKP